MKPLAKLPIKIFADGANREEMIALYKNPLIQGFTTNPTLMKKAGIRNYESYARDLLQTIAGKPVSFEALSDDFNEMRKQALQIQSWQKNVYVKIPITNTRGESSLPLIGELAKEGVQVNVTAILTSAQVEGAAKTLLPSVPSFVSVFAGRIADTGRDPVPVMQECRTLLKTNPRAELLWGSVREILNILQAASAGCHIVTVPHGILNKALKTWGMDLTRLSLETVRMFHDDAVAAGLSL